MLLPTVSILFLLSASYASYRRRVGAPIVPVKIADRISVGAKKTLSEVASGVSAVTNTVTAETIREVPAPPPLQAIAQTVFLPPNIDRVKYVGFDPTVGFDPGIGFSS